MTSSSCHFPCNICLELVINRAQFHVYALSSSGGVKIHYLEDTLTAFYCIVNVCAVTYHSTSTGNISIIGLSIYVCF